MGLPVGPVPNLSVRVSPDRVRTDPHRKDFFGIKHRSLASSPMTVAGEAMAGGEEEQMLYASQAKVSRTAGRWAWLNRPLETLDNPVRRYLGNRTVGPGLWKREPRPVFRSRVLRPAF